MKKPQKLLAIVFMCMLPLIFSCGGGGGGGDGGEVPSPTVDVTGTWTGTYSTSLVSSTPVTLILTQTAVSATSLSIKSVDGSTKRVVQSAANVTGTFTAPQVEGTVSGTVSGNTLTFTLNQTTASCTGAFNGTATVSGNTMTFTFTGSDCLGTHANGQGTATKQVQGINAPSNLSASAISTTQINLSLTDNSNNEEHFMVERKTGSGGTYSQIAEVGVDVTTYSDTGLSPNTTYFYRVRAHSAALGYSSYSNEASATTQGGMVISDGKFKGTQYTELTVKDNKITFVEVSMPGTCSGTVAAGVWPSNGIPIINGQFTVQWHNPASTYPTNTPAFDMTVYGTFSDNNSVNGTWSFSNTYNCQMSGLWSATRQ